MLILLAIPGCTSGPAAAPVAASAGTDMHSDPPIWPATLPTLRWSPAKKEPPSAKQEVGAMPTRAHLEEAARTLLQTHYGPFPPGIGLVPEDDLPPGPDADDLPAHQPSLAMYLTWHGLRTEHAFVVYQDDTSLTVGHADPGTLQPEPGNDAPLLSPATVRRQVEELLKRIGIDPARANEVRLRLEFVQPFGETRSWALHPVWMLVPGRIYVDARTGALGGSC